MSSSFVILYTEVQKSKRSSLTVDFTDVELMVACSTSSRHVPYRSSSVGLVTEGHVEFVFE